MCYLYGLNNEILVVKMNTQYLGTGRIVSAFKGDSPLIIRSIVDFRIRKLLPTAEYDKIPQHFTK